MTAAESITWIDPDGAWYSWPCEMKEFIEGRGMPPVSTSVDEIPGRHGGVRRNARYGVRRISIPVILSGEYGAMKVVLRTLASKLNTVDTEGILRFTTYDGSVRQIQATYIGGLELIETNRVQQATVEFECYDPFFEDASETSSFVTASSPTAFLPLTLPFTLSDGGISGTLAISNTGDMEAWPIFELLGPMVNPTISNGTRSLTLLATIEAGETVTIDTRPNVRTIESTAGDNLFALLSSGSLFFPLAKGSNSITMAASGTSAGVSKMTIRYRRKWLTA